METLMNENIEIQQTFNTWVLGIHMAFFVSKHSIDLIPLYTYNVPD